VSAQAGVAAATRNGGDPVSVTSPAALEMVDVCAGYGDLRVLHNLSMRLEAGRIEVVLGRNGVGKTTLLSSITGLVSMSSGHLLLDGEDIRRAPTHRRARAGIALVQEGKRVFRQLTVIENMMLGTIGRSMRRRERTDYCQSLLAARFPVLCERLDDGAGSLSGGQQQMLAIAQALASEPRILLLDEPSAGLAPAVAVEVFERIHDLRATGLTVLLVEQLADLALAVADHVTVIDNGRVADQGSPDRFRDRAVLEAAYFG
jgi:branched-chain amino acid transport system ATP-binding protein